MKVENWNLAFGIWNLEFEVSGSAPKTVPHHPGVPLWPGVSGGVSKHFLTIKSLL